MHFVDRVEVRVKGGDGGNGLVAFRREKYMPRGGPSGGNGGHGGSVVFKAAANVNTLVDFRYKKHYRAGRGGDGGPNDRYGKSAKNLVLPVPIGTMIMDAETGKLLADLTKNGQKYIASKGGEGGRGNAAFADSVHQTPRFAEKGEPVEEVSLILELKLLADVGLVGFPSVGKSTIISRVSSAKPKIADYPFTTLVPNLGVVRLGDEKSFVLADMPGIIEGAHEGVGLGIQFLKHIERTRLTVHVIDVSGMTGRNAAEDFDVINKEMASHSERLASLPQIVALNKCDMPDAAEIVAELRPALEAKGYEVHEVSAVTGEGLQKLMFRIGDLLDAMPKEEEPEDETALFTIEAPEPEWRAIKEDENVFRVTGKKVEMMVARTDLGNEYAIRHLHRQLDKMGVIKELEKLGAKDGDTVYIKDTELMYSDEAY